MKRESILCYRSFYEAIQKLPQESQLLAYQKLMSYSFDGIETECEDALVDMIRGLIKPNIDSNNDKYLRGKKGGRPKGKTTGSGRKKPQVKNSKEKIKSNEDEEEDVNVNDNVNDNERKKKMLSSFSSKVSEKISDFEQHRAGMKSKMSEKALNLFVNKITKLSKDYQDTELIEMIDTAIMSGRKSIYPPKESNHKLSYEQNRDDFTF